MSLGFRRLVQGLRMCCQAQSRDILQDGGAGAMGGSGNICETSWVSVLCPQEQFLCWEH